MEIFSGEAIFPKIRTHWGKGRDQEMSSPFHFPKLWRHPSQTSGLSHPFPVRYHSCRKTEKAFIPCLKVQACFFLRTLDSNICPVSMARVDTDQLFPRTKGSSRKGKGGPPKAPAVGLNYPLSQMQVHSDQAQRGHLWVACGQEWGHSGNSIGNWRMSPLIQHSGEAPEAGEACWS